MKVTQTTEGILIKVTVKPKANNFKIEQEENNLLVHCRSLPEKGKVNKELMKELSKLFGHEVFIVSGLTSKEKIILIKGAKSEELRLLLSKLPGS
jgi:hypothetical protein